MVYNVDSQLCFFCVTVPYWKGRQGPQLNLRNSDHHTLHLCGLFVSCFIFNDLYKCRYSGLISLKEHLPFPLQHLSLFSRTRQRLESSVYNFGAERGSIFLHLRGPSFPSRPWVSPMSVLTSKALQWALRTPLRFPIANNYSVHGSLTEISLDLFY